MVAIAVVTYATVFNLERMAEIYQTRRKKLIESMLNDSKWKVLGGKFRKTLPDTPDTPDHDGPEPSEWWVLVYFILRLFKSSVRKN
jgi:hypothetical protein